MHCKVVLYSTSQINQRNCWVSIPSRTRFLDPLRNQPPVYRHTRPMSYKHANLHHPPVRHCVGGQTPVEDSDLERGHPAKEAEFEEEE